MSFHSTLTAIESNNTYHTTASFMNAKFEEILDNTEANKGNITKIYKSLTEINSTFTEETLVKNVILAMQNNSMAMYDVLGYQGVYPMTYACITIFKINENRNRVEVTDISGKQKWLTNYHSNSNPNCEWSKITMQTKTEITSSMLKNKWTLKSNHTNSIIKTGDKMSVDLTITGGTLTSSTIVCQGLPTVAKDMLLQVQSDTKQAYMATYKTNGSIILLNTLASAAFYHIHN